MVARRSKRFERLKLNHLAGSLGELAMKTSRPLIVVRTDEAAGPVCRVVEDMARNHWFDGKLIVEAREFGSEVVDRKLNSWDFQDGHAESANHLAWKLAERLLSESSLRVGIEVRTRLTASQVAIAAAEHNADSVFITRDAPATGWRSLGTPFESQVCRTVNAPVWCVDSKINSGPVVVAVNPEPSADDGIAFNRQLVRDAVALATSRVDRPDVHLVAAWSLSGIAPSEWRRGDVATSGLIMRVKTDCHLYLTELAAMVEEAGLNARLHSVEGLPAVAITRTVKEIQPSVLLIGNRRRSGVQHALRPNVAEAVLKRVSCSLLSVVRRERDNVRVHRPVEDRTERPSVSVAS